MALLQPFTSWKLIMLWSLERKLILKRNSCGGGFRPSDSLLAILTAAICPHDLFEWIVERGGGEQSEPLFDNWWDQDAFISMCHLTTNKTNKMRNKGSNKRLSQSSSSTRMKHINFNLTFYYFLFLYTLPSYINILPPSRLWSQFHVEVSHGNKWSMQHYCILLLL